MCETERRLIFSGVWRDQITGIHRHRLLGQYKLFVGGAFVGIGPVTLCFLGFVMIASLRFWLNEQHYIFPLYMAQYATLHQPVSPAVEQLEAAARASSLPLAKHPASYVNTLLVNHCCSLASSTLFRLRSIETKVTFGIF
jgi:hypothetical protein